MPRSSRDEEFSAFVQTRRTGLVRSACLLTAGALISPKASSRPQPSHSPSGQTAAPDKQSRQIKLVAWVGTQPPGYRVNWMPKGWVVQGSTPYVLVMAAPNATDKSPDSYIGKLVVMLQSRDATAPPADWASQPVNGRPGKFDVQGDTQILTFRIAGGQWVVVRPRSRSAGTAPNWPSSPAACRYWSPRSRGAAEPASPA